MQPKKHLRKALLLGVAAIALIVAALVGDAALQADITVDTHRSLAQRMWWRGKKRWTQRHMAFLQFWEEHKPTEGSLQPEEWRGARQDAFALFKQTEASKMRVKRTNSRLKSAASALTLEAGEHLHGHHDHPAVSPSPLTLEAGEDLHGHHDHPAASPSPLSLEAGEHLHGHHDHPAASPSPYPASLSALHASPSPSPQPLRAQGAFASPSPAPATANKWGEPFQHFKSL